MISSNVKDVYCSKPGNSSCHFCKKYTYYWDPTNKYSNSTTSCLDHATGIIRVLRPFPRQHNSTHHLSHDNESLGQALLSTSWWFFQPGHWIRSQAGGGDWHACAGPSTVSHPGSASCKRAVCISAATRQLPSHLSLVQILMYFLHPSLYLLRQKHNPYHNHHLPMSIKLPFSAHQKLVQLRQHQ